MSLAHSRGARERYDRRTLLATDTLLRGPGQQLGEECRRPV
jgi:hypothetical protein